MSREAPKDFHCSDVVEEMCQLTITDIKRGSVLSRVQILSFFFLFILVHNHMFHLIPSHYMLPLLLSLTFKHHLIPRKSVALWRLYWITSLTKCIYCYLGNVLRSLYFLEVKMFFCSHAILMFCQILHVLSQCIYQCSVIVLFHSFVVRNMIQVFLVIIISTVTEV